MNNQIKLYLQNYNNDLTKTDKLIQKYLLENWETNFIGKEISFELKVSQASVSKFIKKISFKSIYEFNKLKHCSDSELIEYLIENKANYLRNSLIMNQPDLITNVVNILEESQTVFVYGIGHSYISAYNFYHRFNKIGLDIVLLRERIDINIHLHRILDTHSTVIIFSDTCKTKEIIHLATFCANNKIDYILFTSNPLASIAEKSIINLIYDTNNLGFLLDTIGPEEPVIFIIDLIYLYYIKANFDNSLTHYNNSIYFISYD